MANNNENYEGFDNLNFDFKCDHSCPPDWKDLPGDLVDFDFSFNPWKNVEYNQVDIDFNCDHDCLPDWVYYPGNALVVSFDGVEPDHEDSLGNDLIVKFSCDSQEPEPEDLVTINGAFTLGQFDVSSEIIFTEAYTVTGNFPLKMTLTGEAQYLADVFTAWGDISLKFSVDSEINRGVSIHSKTGLALDMKLTGEALWSEEIIEVAGNVNLGDFKVTSSIQHFQYREVFGDFGLGDVVLTGVALETILVDGFHSILDITLSGEATLTIPTVLPSSVKLGDITLVGDANYNFVPTAGGSIKLDMPIYGDVQYVALPTAWGDITLDIKIISEDESGNPNPPVQNGVIVYFSYIELDFKVESEVTHPIMILPAELGIGEIELSGTVLPAVTEIKNQFGLGTIKFIRSYAHFGEDDPAIATQIYESSNIRSADIRHHPKDAKYAIYVPTTDYDIHDVVLRRGTVDYTFSFRFDAEEVSTIKVWMLDKVTGNSVQDVVRYFVSGKDGPYTLVDPFNPLYTVSIPIHCVNNKRYEYYLEVIFKSERLSNTVQMNRESYLVPFQAHFDNEKLWTNATDTFKLPDSNFKSNPRGMLEWNSEPFDSISLVLEDSIGRIGIGNNFAAYPMTSEFFELGMQIQSSDDYFRMGHIVSRGASMVTEYTELDIGQIGG